MSTIEGSDNLAWSDEQTRFYLQLRLDEKLKGNIRKDKVNEAGRQFIIDKFYEVYGKRHPWKKFGIKFTTCKKQYETFRKLTHNRTGLGYYANGSIHMSEDWWNDRCKEWPGARKIKDKPVPNTDLMQKVFGTCHISGAEGWTAQQGEKHLDKTMSMYEEVDPDADVESREVLPTQDPDADAESRQIPPTQVNNHAGPSSSNIGNGPSSSNRSRASKKRSRSVQEGGEAVAEVIRESVQSRDKILSHKNQLIESHPELTCNQLRAMEVLHSLPTIRMWSPLYKASIQHLKQDMANRQTFLFYGDDENKILYLEFATGESRDA
ncbi:Myb/SANT-like domain [Arabidopsis thaliana x Arabidopsis arenosa]|uniref:Myb/SANT-like domain n=1 Tax=Arabidopsis thaliana x Arabidopsis arenosa TaxID=1240361 RepID=A0A8T2BZ60_9BRAS|nr:Myb/SANT-like domain [Arabidopsis thaliana x Arabidopsis arenosa]